jgi:hypothetical protein
MKTARTREEWLEIGVAMLGWAALLFFAACVLAYVVQYARISMGPETASGVVEEKSAEVNRGEDLMDRFTLRYSFTAASGLGYSGEANVGKSFYAQVGLGDRLGIEYAADDPGNNRVRGELDPEVVFILVMVGLSASLFAFGGVWRLARHLMTRG